MIALTVEGQGAGGYALPAVQGHAPILGSPAPPPRPGAGVAVAPHPRHTEVSPFVNKIIMIMSTLW